MDQKPSHNLSIVDNVNSFNVINVNTGMSDEDNQIREWLSPLKPQQRHQGVRAERFDGVGDWFVETSEVRRWSNGDGGSPERVLFCSGGPGVGQTYLWQEHPTSGKGKKISDVTDKYENISSLVIDNLCDQAGEKDLAVAWLYCDFLAHSEQSATAMIGAILKQLVSIRRCRRMYDRHFENGFPTEVYDYPI